MKRIAVLTSGGDSPGMNAALRAVVRNGIEHDMEVYAVHSGYEGLIDNKFERMSRRSVADTLQRGGTIIKTARSKRFHDPENRKIAYKNLEKLKIEGLVVIGGNGSLEGARILSEESDVLVMGLPGTIDNDLAYTDYTIGFDTAVNTVLDAITKIRDTSSSHDRSTVIEVMGRHCGDIALTAAVSTGSEIVVVPEVPWTVEGVAMQLQRQLDRGNYRATIVVAEGCWESMAPFDLYNFLTSRGKPCYPEEPMSAVRFASVMKRMCGMVEARANVIGYVQRGAEPTARDSAFAFEAGNLAVRLLRDGISNQVIGMQKGKVFYMPIEKALKKERYFNRPLFDLVNSL